MRSVRASSPSVKRQRRQETQTARQEGRQYQFGAQDGGLRELSLFLVVGFAVWAVQNFGCAVRPFEFGLVSAVLGVNDSDDGFPKGLQNARLTGSRRSVRNVEEMHTSKIAGAGLVETDQNAIEER
jgi:hypothetical protein